MPKNLSQKKYRYNIREKLANLEPLEKTKTMNFVLRTSKRAYNTIYRHINEPYGGKKHNDYTILSAFAEKLNCTTDELINK